jgi:two-component system response regulator NreC
MQKIRVLIADDHTMFREGIRSLLEAGGIEVIAEATHGREAVQKANELEPDLVLMDIGMPIMDGIEATRQIKKENPEVQVLALTMHDNEEYLFQILKAGGSGYVVKKAAVSELILAIQAAYDGKCYLTPSVSRALVEDYLRRVKDEGVEPSYGSLTNREREILKLIAEGYTNQEIADLLFLSIKTIQTHRAHLMEKLGFHDRTELVKYALRKGLIEP